MAVSKKFLEAVSQNAALKAELDKAAFEALGDFLKAKRLEADAADAVEAAVSKIAEAHGFKAEAMEEVSEDELEAVAGGSWLCKSYGWGEFSLSPDDYSRALHSKGTDGKDSSI